MTVEDIGDALANGDRCGHCGCTRLPSTAWYHCAQCRDVGYCSRAHQKTALAAHRKECGAASSGGSTTRSTTSSRVSTASSLQASLAGRQAQRPLPWLQEVIDAAADCPALPTAKSIASPTTARERSKAAAVAVAGQDVLAKVLSSLRPAAAGLLDVSHELLVGVLKDLLCNELPSCLLVCSTLRKVVLHYANVVLLAPWWFGCKEQRLALVGVLTFCPVVLLLQLRRVCRSWNATIQHPDAWSSVRLTYGWGLDGEMIGLMRAMRHVGVHWKLRSIPDWDATENCTEVPPRSPTAGPHSAPPSPNFHPAPRSPMSRGWNPLLTRATSQPSSPSGGCGSPANQPGLLRTTSAASSAGSRAGAAPRSVSQLVLCRHEVRWQDKSGQRSPADGDSSIWLLQPEAERWSSDPCRRAVCTLLSEQPDLTDGKAILEVNSSSGLVSLHAAQTAKAVTVTSPSDLGLRMINVNFTLYNSDAGPSRMRRSGNSKRHTHFVRGSRGNVPLYLYTLPVNERGIGDFARQWQWDSGTAMRGLNNHVVSPRFDLIIVAAFGTKGQHRVSD
eukprot:TRINITY_DN34540_c0_g1_i2.p1 TRINITY_DN34540_c0_g1~~TRINITY_DN34540_c0_g1_i2.p1  ORF type:complete len:559 (+),score=88.64 TRINITY_DN34540_c0_g1_i2:167-1843(+)